MWTIESYTKFMDDKVDSQVIPGVIFGIYDENNQTIIEHMHGATTKNGYNSVNEKSIYRMASMTKPLTGVACLICQERGLLSVYDKISKYLPSFKKMKVGKLIDGKICFDHYAKREITIFDILTHSSGLGSGPIGDQQITNGGKYTFLSDQVEKYSSWFLDFDPGEKSIYSGVVALDIVARIIEIVTNQKYYDFLKQNLLNPLEMVDTTYKLNDEQRSRQVDVYNLNIETGTSTINEDPTGFPFLHEDYQSGCAGINSTLSDYRNFCYMLLCNGVYKGKRILSEKTMKEIKTQQLIILKEGVDENNNWGLGAMHVRGPHHILDEGSFGWSGAFSTHFFINPKRKIYAILLDSLGNNGGEHAILNDYFEYAVMSMYNKNKTITK